MNFQSIHRGWKLKGREKRNLSLKITVLNLKRRTEELNS
jgi:hypothetical protein